MHGHAKGEHRPFSEERPIAYSPRMLFLWFYHAARRNSPRFLMVSDHINYLTFEDPGAVHTVRRALKLAHAGDLYGAAETAGVDVAHAQVVSEGLKRGMRFSIGAEVDNDPRARPDAQNIVDAMRPDGIIRSVHFLSIDHPEKGADFQWPYDNPEFANLYDHVGVERVWEIYVDRLVDDIEKLPGHVVGHFYKPAIFGHWPSDAKMQAHEDRMLDAAAARGMAVEINTRMLYRHPDTNSEKFINATKRLMKKAKKKGVGIAIGSDAHSPKDQGAGFDIVLRLLDECDINEIVFPVAGRLARVVLRATKEHLEAHRSPEPVQAGSSISGFSRAELGLPEEPDRPAKVKAVKAVAAAKTAHDVGPKKRASSPKAATATSKRSAESAASSAKAKDTKTAAKAAPEKKVAVAKKPAAKAAPVKKVAPAKAAPAKKVATPAKKVAPVKAAPAKKVAAPAKKVAPVKAAPLKKVAVPAKKAAAPAKKAAAPAKKAAAPVKKAAAPVKKVVASSKKAAPAKKTAPAKKAAPLKKAVPAKKAAPAKKAKPKKK